MVSAIILVRVQRNPHWMRVETLSPINESSTSFLYDLGRRILLVSEDRERQFLFQRISVAIQCFNAVQLHAVFLSSDHRD